MSKLWKACLAWQKELGVNFALNCDVTSIEVAKNNANSVTAEISVNQPELSQRKLSTINCTADVVISGADYHFTETQLLPEIVETYSDEYWNKRVMAPSWFIILHWF